MKKMKQLKRGLSLLIALVMCASLVQLPVFAEGTENCEACDGTGKITCTACQGEGKVKTEADCPDCENGFLPAEDGEEPKTCKTCKTCQGSGTVQTEGDTCPVCDGTSKVTCSACSGTGKKPCEHTYDAVVTEPTCEKGGYTTHTCSKCGDSYTSDETEATGHKWDNEEPAYGETVTCTVCGKTYVAADEGINPAADGDGQETGYNGEDLPAGPDMSGTEVTVTPENAQYTLDGAYGSIDGKTIVFDVGEYPVLELGRGTKYAGSGTVYYNMHWNGGSWVKDDKNPVSLNELSTGNDGIVKTYHRPMRNVTFQMEEGAVLAGFKATDWFQGGESGPWDYVRDVQTQNNNPCYYLTREFDNITFDGLTINGQIWFWSAMAATTQKNITIKDCIFVGDESKMGQNTYPAIRLNSEQGANGYENLVITNNKMTNFFQGIHCQYPKGASIDGNEISNTTHNAIALQGTVEGKIEISYNTIAGAKDRAIRLGNIGATAEILVSGNTAIDSGDSDGEIMKAGTIAPGASVTIATDNNWGEGKSVHSGLLPVAEVGGKQFTTLQGAIAAAGEGDTVTVLASETPLEIKESIVISGKSVTLDLNEQTLNGSAANLFTVQSGAGLTITGNGRVTSTKKEIISCFGEAVIENGTFEVPNAGSLLSNAVMRVSGPSASLTFKQGSISASAHGVSGRFTAGMYGIYVENSASLVLGDADKKTSPAIDTFYPCVGMNNLTSPETPAANITIYGGSYTSYAEQPVYGTDHRCNTVLFLPASANVTIHDGTFTMANREDVEQNGPQYAISIPYHTAVNLTILGGEFTSTDDVIFKPEFDSKVTTTVPPDVKVSGGVFSSDVKEYCVSGLTTKQGADGRYTIEAAEGSAAQVVGGGAYPTLAEAIANCPDGGTVKLLTNVPENIEISGKNGITLDGNGFRITGAEGNDAHGINVYCSENVTLKNVSVTGAGKSGLAVNASSVTVEGTLDLSGNGGDGFWSTRMNVGYGENITGRHPTSLAFAEGAGLTGVEMIYSDSGDVERAKANGDTITIGDVPGLVKVVGVTGCPNCWITEAQAQASAAAMIARDGETTYYTTLQAAVTAAQEGDTVTLLKDSSTGVVAGQYKPTLTGAAFTLDLNGHSIRNPSTDDKHWYYGLTIQGLADVTVKNSGGPAEISAVSTYSGGISLWDQGRVTIESDDITVQGGAYGICGNGSQTTGTATITVKGGTVTATSETGAGIFNPHSGDLIIGEEGKETGPSISGGVGVQACAGHVTIYGGTITGTGADAREGKTGDGVIPDGAAVSIVERGYSSTPALTIYGGTFTTEKGPEAVISYSWRNDTSVADSWEDESEHIAVSGGSFSTAVRESHCAESFLPVQNSEGNYGVSGDTLTITGGAAVRANESFQLSVSPATTAAVVWSSSNEAIATVSPNGLVSGKAEGTVTITAKVGGAEATLEVTVTAAVQPEPTTTYKITFKIRDGVADEVQTYKEGEKVVPPTVENYTSGRYRYTFSGWSPALVETAQADATYTAQFTSRYTGGSGGGGGGGSSFFGGSSTTPQRPTVTVTDPETPLAETPFSFTDVKESDWCYEAVKYVSEKGLMNGVTGTTFVPNRTLTRGMLVTILHRLENSPKTETATSFPDVAEGRYFTEAIAWGSANGVITGYTDGTFRPDQPVSRQQMAVILYRYASLKGYDVSGEADLSAYNDVASIGNFASTAMKWANAVGLINGNKRGNLNPGNSATRAHAAAILMRFCENVAK